MSKYDMQTHKMVNIIWVTVDSLLELPDLRGEGYLFNTSGCTSFKASQALFRNGLLGMEHDVALVCRSAEVSKRAP